MEVALGLGMCKTHLPEDWCFFTKLASFVSLFIALILALKKSEMLLKYW